MQLFVGFNMARMLGFFGGHHFVKKYPELISLIDRINGIPYPSVPGYAKYDCHTPILNGAIEMLGENQGWTTQPFVDNKSENREVDWKGDISKVMTDGLRVFVEIELGHSKSNFANLSKFELSSMIGTYDFFLLGVPGQELNKGIYYPSDFNHFQEREEFYKQFIHAPCVIFEIEPLEKINIPEVTGLEVNSTNFPAKQGAKWGKKFIVEHNLERSLGLI